MKKLVIGSLTMITLTLLILIGGSVSARNIDVGILVPILHTRDLAIIPSTLIADQLDCQQNGTRLINIRFDTTNLGNSISSRYFSFLKGDGAYTIGMIGYRPDGVMPGEIIHNVFGIEYTGGSHSITMEIYPTNYLWISGSMDYSSMYSYTNWLLDNNINNNKALLKFNVQPCH